MFRFRLDLLALTGLLLAGCGAPRCDSTTCTGCCGDGGMCLGFARQNASQCGVNGASCALCQTSQACQQGQCLGSLDSGVDAGVDAGMDAGADAGQVDDGGIDAGPSCGAQGQPCCGAGACQGELQCLRAQCTAVAPFDAGFPCGGLGQSCCATQCFSPFTCQQDVCRAVADAGPAKALGEACLANAECPQGLCLRDQFPQGTCSKACETSAECPNGSQCANNPSSGPLRICLAQCQIGGVEPGGCRSGYVCERNAGTSGIPVCFPKCTSTASCGTAPSCDTRGFCCGSTGAACCGGTGCEPQNDCVNGYCAALSCGSYLQPCCYGVTCSGQLVCQANTCVSCGAPGQPCCSGSVCATGRCENGSCVLLGSTGTPCSDGQECSGQLCVGASGSRWQGGYCTQYCPQISCRGSAQCSPYLMDGQGLCLATCSWDGGAGGCRDGYICDRGVFDKQPSQGGCFPKCTFGSDCATGTKCEGGFCCGLRGFRCCTSGTPCSTGTCNSEGYCQ